MTSTPVWDAYRTAISEGAAHWTAKGADPMSAAAAVAVYVLEQMIAERPSLAEQMLEELRSMP